MPGAAEVCLETECDKLQEIEAGKLWTAVTTIEEPDEDYVGPPHNRMVVMLLDAGVGGHGTKTLVLVNPIDPTDELIAELKALETAQDATVRYLLSTGDWHWLFIGNYLPEFPDATAYVPPGRIPDLADGPSFAYTEYDISAPLASLRPALQIYNMDGLVQPQMMPGYDNTSTRNELFFYHESTKTVVAGDLFWLFACEPTPNEDTFWPGAAKGSVRVWNAYGNSIWSPFEDQITEARASANLLLGLDFTRFIPIHGELGNMVPPDANPTAKDLVDAALRSNFGILPGRLAVMM